MSEHECCGAAWWSRQTWPRRIAALIGGIALAAVLAFLLGFLVMLLWNWLMPEIFDLPRISYWQGWGLVILAHILLKAGPGHHDHRNHRDWKSQVRKKVAESDGGQSAEGSVKPDEFV